MSRPLVSIVIPTYNRARIVTRAVDSAVGQTYTNVEVIVVDDGSTDETQAVLQRYAERRNVRVLTHTENRGATAAKNTGLDALRGTFATILDSDDELLPHAVATVLAAFERLGPEVGMVFANCIDARTGEFTGKGLTESGAVTFADALRERFTGEFWGIWRTESLGTRRFDTRLAGGESLVWHDMYRSTRVWYLHEGLRRYERGSPDSVSRLQLDPAQVSRTRMIYERYLEQFGEDLLRIEPRVYAKNLQAIALWHILAGERVQGIRRLVESIRHGADLRQAAMAVAMAIAPKSILRRELERRRRG